jgi:hypothetical protein
MLYTNRPPDGILDREEDKLTTLTLSNYLSRLTESVIYCLNKRGGGTSGGGGGIESGFNTG